MPTTVAQLDEKRRILQLEILYELTEDMAEAGRLGPQDLIESVAAGVDLFDCVMPTRNARNGSLFTSTGKINIKRAEFAADPRPLDGDCPCEACTDYSRAYLRHLYLSGEILAARLHTIHNLTYYLGLMRTIRDAIAAGRLESLRRRLGESDDG